MHSPCGERQLLLTLAAVAALAAGCSREERHFGKTLPSDVPASIALTDLRAGDETPPASASGPFLYNAYAIAQGKRLFTWYNCTGCHAHGGGDSGPPLMDERWIYGSEPANIFATIVQGRPNGMPSFRDQLSETQVWQLVAYVESLTGRLSRDALPARDDHLYSRPGEQSLSPRKIVQ